MSENVPFSAFSNDHRSHDAHTMHAISRLCQSRFQILPHSSSAGKKCAVWRFQTMAVSCEVVLFYYALFRSVKVEKYRRNVFIILLRVLSKVRIGKGF